MMSNELIQLLQAIQTAMTLMPAGSSVRGALGHHHGLHITCKIVQGQQARMPTHSSEQLRLEPGKACSWVSNILSSASLGST